MKRRVFAVCAFALALMLGTGLVGCGQDKAYEPKTLTPTVDAPVVGESGTLRVGVDADGGAPFVTSSEGTMEGLDPDMAAALANQLGLKLKLVNVGADAETALKNGEVDLVMGLSATDESSTAWISEPYVQTGVVLFAGAGNTTVPTRESSPKIAAQSSSTSAWAVENAFGDAALQSRSDLTSAFSSIETSEAAYVAADAVIGTYAALYQNVDLAPVALLGSAGGYCVGVASSNAELQTAVADALSAISGNGVAGVVCSKWLGAPIDLSSLAVIEVSTSKAQSDANTADGEEGESKPKSESDVAKTEGNGSTAGSNAVLPGAA